MDFWYLALAPKIDNTTCSLIDSALNKFHANKQAILDANACLCKGNKPINNWYIPKLEILHSVVLNIHANGAPYQWSANITEYAHQTVTKDPGQAENNQGYDAQICWAIDHIDKVQWFDLVTSIQEAGVDYGVGESRDDDVSSDNELAGAYHIDQTSTLLTSIHPVSNLVGPLQTHKDYFKIAKDLSDGRFPHAKQPYHSFSILSTAFHLNHNPTFCNISVDEASSLFGLSDLCPALADFLRRTAHDGLNMPLPIGGHHAALPNAQLLFDSIQI